MQLRLFEKNVFARVKSQRFLLETKAGHGDEVRGMETISEGR